MACQNFANSEYLLAGYKTMVKDTITDAESEPNTISFSFEPDPFGMMAMPSVGS